MSRRVLYSVLEGDVLVTDLETGEAIWTGRPMDHPVAEVIPIPDSSMAVVLLDYSAAPAGGFENLLAIDEQGRIRWRAKLPTTGNDTFTEVDVTPQGVEAFTWSAYNKILDARTGATISMMFTK